MWILEPLRPLREAFKAEGATIASVTAALRQFLEHMELREKLEEYRDFFLERKEPGMRTWPGNMARSMTAYWNCLSGWKDFWARKKRI